jgi:hypothetical protein
LNAAVLSKSRRHDVLIKLEIKDDMNKQQDKSSPAGFLLFLVPHLFCCALLPLLLLSGVSLNFESSVWLIMGGLFIALGIGIFGWCAKCVFRADVGNDRKSRLAPKGN